MVASPNPYRAQYIAIPSILVAIIAASVISSVVLYSVQTQQYVQLNRDLESQLEDNISAKSFHVSQVTALHISNIVRSTEILAAAISIQNGDQDSIIELLESAANSSDEIQSFFVFDKNAILLYTTSASKSSIGTAFPNQTAFVGAKQSGTTFISNLTRSLDGTYRIFVSSPIIDPTSHEFNGVIGASILSDTLTASVKNEVALNPSDSLTLIDPAGNIITASGNSTVGRNVLSDEVLGQLPPSIRTSLTQSLIDAIEGNSGVYTINLNENPELNNTGSGVDLAMIAYSPVILGGKIRMISFVVESANIRDLASQSENLAISSTYVFIYVVLAAMAVFAAAIIMINRKLIRKIVKATAALNESNLGLKKLASELEEKTAKLQEADTAKEEFSAMITHELKTPLVPIIGYSELLLDGTLGDLTVKQKQKIKIMQQNAASLSRLISDLLDVRKLELGQMKLDMVPVSAREIIEQSIESIQPLANSKNVTFVFFGENDADEQLLIKADPKRIQQVFNNLFTNAIKYVPEQTGKVEVSLQKSDDNSLIFAVKDNGIGIPADKHENLFKKFYQVDTSLRRSTGGSGLGLAISKGIVEAHGGKMWFESEAGAGSIFYFSIPKLHASSVENPEERLKSK